MKKIILIAFLSLFVPFQALAFEGLTVNYSAGYPNPLFNETNLAPGDTITKSISITNNYTDTKQISFKLTKKPIGELSDVILVTVKHEGVIVSDQKSLLDIYTSGNELPLTSIGSGQTEDYEFIVSFDINAGNEYQNKSEEFDLNFGFTADDSSPTTTTTSTTSPIRTMVSGATTTTVLGATTTTTSSGITTTTKPEVKGSATEDKGACPWWWIVLLVLAAVSTIYYFYKNNKEEKGKLLYVWPVALGAVAWVVHWYLHKDYDDTIFCKWYWLIVPLLVLLVTAIYRILTNSNEENEE